MDWALRVVEAIAFSLHAVIGVTEPCHEIMTGVTQDSLPYPAIFFPVAGLSLALVVLANFSGQQALVLGAQAYVIAFHTGAVFTHLRIGHHPAAASAPGLFVLIAFIIVALRTSILIALLGTTFFVGVGVLLGRLIVKRPAQPKGCRTAPIDDGPYSFGPLR